MKTKFRTVPDTNVIIASQNASATSPNREYFARWANDEFVLLYSEDTLHEYIRKLTERGVPQEIIQKLLVSLMALGEKVFIQFFHLPKYPVDPDDIAFLLCAENGKASHLISYDKHLKMLDGDYDFKICEPIAFLVELRSKLKR